MCREFCFCEKNWQKETFPSEFFLEYVSCTISSEWADDHTINQFDEIINLKISGKFKWHAMLPCFSWNV